MHTIIFFGLSTRRIASSYKTKMISRYSDVDTELQVMFSQGLGTDGRGQTKSFVSSGQKSLEQIPLSFCSES